MASHQAFSNQNILFSDSSDLINRKQLHINTSNCMVKQKKAEQHSMSAKFPIAQFSIFKHPFEEGILI